MNYERSANVGLYFLLGGVAGAAVALCFAPRSGTETRQFLGDKMREGQELAGRAVDAGRRMAQQAAVSLRRRKTDAAEYVSAELGSNGGQSSL